MKKLFFTPALALVLLSAAQVHAQTGSQITGQVFCTLDSFGTPTNIFNLPTCGDTTPPPPPPPPVPQPTSTPPLPPPPPVATTTDPGTGGTNTGGDTSGGGNTGGGSTDTGGTSTGDNGGSSSGGGGGGGAGGFILGDSTEDCSEYLNSFIRMGGTNDPQQVGRLQHVLHDFEAANIEVTGIYDTKTLAAVNAFQTKYASEVLIPWGLKKSTGFVYLTTRKKINEVYCNGLKTFPLTDAQAQEVARYKTHATQPAAVKPAAKKDQTAAVAASAVTTNSTAVAASSTPAHTGVWGSITKFFSKVLHH